MKDKLKVFIRKYSVSALCFLLAGAVIVSVFCFPKEKEQASAQKRVVRVWNVDTFEGGKGSRTSYLKNAARRVEKKREGVYFLVTSYTAEGAREAVGEGNFPDALSFGVGLSDFLERSLPVFPYFSGGEAGGKTYAYPWCRGGYALFSLTDSFEEEGETVVSCGGSNLAEVAAFLSGHTGQALPSNLAYTKFLGGEFRYLFGTQRDLCRFAARGKEVFYRPIEEFCDLYQYFSVLSEEKKEDCLALFEELTASEEELSKIGMYPALKEGDFCKKPKLGVSVFSSNETLSTLLDAAKRGDEKNLRKYLKTV